ncbi:MAG: hypothetical protein AAFR61_21470 [Bacteroidota bacterium]
MNISLHETHHLSLPYSEEEFVKVLEHLTYPLDAEKRAIMSQNYHAPFEGELSPPTFWLRLNPKSADKAAAYVRKVKKRNRKANKFVQWRRRIGISDEMIGDNLFSRYHVIHSGYNVRAKGKIKPALQGISVDLTIQAITLRGFIDWFLISICSLFFFWFTVNNGTFSILNAFLLIIPTFQLVFWYIKKRSLRKFSKALVDLLRYTSPTDPKPHGYPPYT